MQSIISIIGGKTLKIGRELISLHPGSDIASKDPCKNNYQRCYN